MKKTSKIEKIYKEKFQELLKHNRAYFEKDSPIISDSEFDELKKEILKLEDKHPSLKNLGGVETAIGYKPSTKFEKIKHSKEMLSLSNAFEKKDMLDFIKK